MVGIQVPSCAPAPFVITVIHTQSASNVVHLARKENAILDCSTLTVV